MKTIPENSILVEAESFDNKGGWLIDQQFMHEMGSPYLIAHGMGTPVENASTKINCSSTGKYHIWVRTKDWCPGEWESPSRFQIYVNDHELKKVFGTKPEWNWENGGSIHIQKKEIKIELVDLTGFDGRCDAIFLTPDSNYHPPDDLEELKEFRKQFHSKFQSNIEDPITFDVVVVGGGIGGCAAALASEAKDLKVALVNDRPVLGGNASSEIRVHSEGILGRSANLLQKINTKHWPNGSAKSVDDDRKRMDTVKNAKGITHFPNTRAIGCKVENNEISSIVIQNIESNLQSILQAPIFIDCTGDSWLAYWSNAKMNYGRESYEKFGERWKEHGDLWSPKNPDRLTMGSSLLWNTMKSKEKIKFPDVPWALDVVGDYHKTNGAWYWEYASENLHQIDDAEEIRDHLLRSVYGSFWNAKKKRKNRKLKLKWVGYLLGKRESRRIVGDYIYSMKDMVNSTEFPDSVCEETRVIDVHYQRNLLESIPDFISKAIFYHVNKYYIPFRCLYSKSVKNLMMAGRNFSCSHIGLGGPRVMNTCGQMGVAVGIAAFLCRKYNCTPKDIYLHHINELRNLIGYNQS